MTTVSWPRAAAGRVGGAIWQGLDTLFGGPARRQVILLLAAILALNSADTAAVGASAAQLRASLHISNTDIGLLVAVTSVVGAVASIPFGVLVDRFHRIRILVASIILWGVATLVSATVPTFGDLLLVRLFLGAVTASSGPAVASLVGDYFPAAERGKIYGYVLAGELLGAGIGFVVAGDIAAISWRAAFVILALPAIVLAWLVARLPEPARGGGNRLPPGATRVLGRRDLPPRRVAGTSEPLTPPATGPPEQAPAVEETDAQQLVRDRGVAPDPALVLHKDPRRMNLFETIKWVLGVRTNVMLIVSSACGYFFLAGAETFGLEFATKQYRVPQLLADLLMLIVGAGAVLGVLVGGRLGDLLLRRRQLNGRVIVAAVAALLAVVLFIPALITHSSVTALPYIAFAGFFLTAQNPPIDAARLDITPPLLWGRAEGIRTFMRAGAQALAPVLFGAFSGLFGGGPRGLQITFIVMLTPLAASGLILLRALRTYPRDVATAAASAHPDGMVGLRPTGEG